MQIIGKLILRILEVWSESYELLQKNFHEACLLFQLLSSGKKFFIIIEFRKRTITVLTVIFFIGCRQKFVLTLKCFVVLS